MSNILKPNHPYSFISVVRRFQTRTEWTVASFKRSSQQSYNVPLLWNILEPLDAGGLVGRVGLASADVDPARDGLVDDGLLLLLQQRDQLLLGTDVPPNAPVRMVEEAHDGDLLGKSRPSNSQLRDIFG